MKMSLRARILLWYGVAMVVVIFGLAFTAQHIMVASLRADLDESLQLRAGMVINAVSSSSAPATPYSEMLKQLTEHQLPSVPLFIRISDPQGNILARFGDIPGSIIPLLDNQLCLVSIAKGRFDSIEVKNTQALRVYTVMVPDQSNSKPLALVQTGESLAAVSAAEDRLWRYALVEGFIGSLVALAVGLVILQRGFRPLDRILSRVQEIRDTELTAGLPAEPRPHELKRLADSLNSMWRRLDSALRAKERFVASVSHDLRTPLTAMQGQIDVLQRKASADSEVKESLERTSKEVRRLVRMTDNLLLNTQLDSMPPIIVRDINLRELLEEIVREVYILAEGLHISLLAEEDVVVPGDYDLLKQMVLNVADNAIKFTPGGGHVELALRAEDGWAVIQVRDSGQGIPPEHLPHIMEPFYKVSSSSSSLRGVGLGLSIVKQIIALHKGQIEINSQVNVGTTVTMRLPIPSS
jgi:signal transduction histidine kinase